MQNRRRIDRQPAHWIGSYKLAGDAIDVWRDCRVVDISSLGIAITFDYHENTDLTGRGVSVNLSGDDGAVNVRIDGEIKNAVPTISNKVRVGIEFVRVAETAQAIATVLSAMSETLVTT